MEGRGKLVMANRDVYVGTFEKDTQHGRGVLTSANKRTVYDGEFFQVRAFANAHASRCPPRVRSYDLPSSPTISPIGY